MEIKFTWLILKIDTKFNLSFYGWWRCENKELRDKGLMVPFMDFMGHC